MISDSTLRTETFMCLKSPFSLLFHFSSSTKSPPRRTHPSSLLYIQPSVPTRSFLYSYHDHTPLPPYIRVSFSTWNIWHPRKSRPYRHVVPFIQSLTNIGLGPWVWIDTVDFHLSHLTKKRGRTSLESGSRVPDSRVIYSRGVNSNPR